MITPTMTVAAVLDRHPQTLEVFVAHHAAFQRLRNPLLRRVFAHMVTVAQAAGIAQIDASSLVAALNAACGEPATSPRPLGLAQHGTRPAPPSWYDPARITGILDVRESQRTQQNPLAVILPAVQQLILGDILLLRTLFEPLPLFMLLERRGVLHWSRQQAAADWLIVLQNTSPPLAQPAETPLADSRAAFVQRCVALDNRGLAPPEPMVRTLAALHELPLHRILLTLTDRPPLVLYEALAEQGYTYETIDAREDGCWTTISLQSATLP